MRVAVAGGTGMVGRLVAERLMALDHEAVVLARSTGVDLVTGQGLDAAMRGVQGVVDVSSLLTTNRHEAVHFFTMATNRLQEVGARVGVSHHVVLSIVGIDSIPMGYYAGKLRQEEEVAAGLVPWSLLRATQFHEFALQMIERASLGPITFVPRMASQPVAAREVATALVDLVVGSPAGRVADLGGPHREDMGDMVRRLLKARGERGMVLPLWIPGAGWAASRSGALRPRGASLRGVQSFAEWLKTDEALRARQ